MNIEEMRILYAKAQNFIDNWIKLPVNFEKIIQEIDSKYLANIDEINFKNSRITLIWSELDYKVYKVCITIYFLGKNDILLAEFKYFEDMEGEYINNEFYFFEIYD